MPSRLYLDEDVAEKLVFPLRALGYDTVTAKEVGRKGSADFMQLLFAAEDERALITHNAKDSRMLHGAWLTWSRR